MDEPLDFEREDQLLATPRPTSKRRKAMCLDDLLTDHYTNNCKLVDSGSKRPTKSKGSNSDDEDEKGKKKERMLIKFVDDCQKQVSEMATEDEISLWGQKIFGYQKLLPTLPFTELGSCELLQSFRKNELDTILDLRDEQGESFLEGWLSNGWLLKLTFICGFVEDSIASWTFYKMLYSSNEELQVSACEFWCSILLSKSEADQPLVRLGWLPSYSQLKDALEIYGYLSDTSTVCLASSKSVHAGSGIEGPPQNIRSWIKVLSACCQIRSHMPIFSTSEAEYLLGVIIYLFLDRQLLGLSFVLHDCMQSIIGFFAENEWDSSCKKIADSIASRIPKDLNCLRVVECISGISTRSKHLRNQVALQILTVCFNKKATDAIEAVELLMSLNVKDKHCDFFKLYIYLTLAENILVWHRSVEETPVAIGWCRYLRNCSTQITSTDWRSYASKVRNKASYLLQNSMQRRDGE